MKSLILLVCCLPFAASSVMAAAITYDFSGTISSNDDGDSVLSAYSLTEGASTFSGSFTYDPEETFYSGDTTTAANYRNEAAFELAIKIDNQWRFLETDPVVSVRNDAAVGGGDLISFAFHTANGQAEEFDFPTLSRYFFNLQFQDQTGTALSDTSLPESIDLNDFGFSHMYIGEYDYKYYVTGRFDSVTERSGQDAGPAPVPEPSTFLLLGSGLVGLGFCARRRKKA